MNRTILFATAALIAVTTGIASFLVLEKNAPGPTMQRVDFQMPDLQGRLRDASEWDGQVVLINFWAPWCAPCRAEIPLLIELQTSLATQEFQVLGPALDKPEATHTFAAEYGINYPVLTGLNDVLDLQESYGDTRLPYTVLLNPQGEVVFRHAGELTEAIITAQIRARVAPAKNQNPL